MKLNNLHNTAERAARVVPVVGGIIVMMLIFYWQYLHKTASMKASLDRWCPKPTATELEFAYRMPPSPECLEPDTLMEVWMPALGRTLLLTLAVAAMLAIVGFSLYAAFTSKITPDTRRPIREWNTLRANLAPIVSVLGTAILAGTMVTILLNMAFGR